MKKSFLITILFTILSSVSVTDKVHAQAEPFVAQIMWTGANFCPRGWAQANGQIISIAQNTALFSLLGTTYGGNGQTTFGLPDLRGRVQIHQGQGPGLSNYSLGQVSGTETNTLTVNQLPAHNHNIIASGDAASKADPSNSFVAASGGFRKNGTNPTVLNPASVGVTGGNQPVNNVQPYLTLMACIALEGIFPPRS